MNGPDDQAMILGSLIGLTLASLGIAALIWWFLR